MNLKPLFSALRFLTLLPIPEPWCGDERDFHKSPSWYPVVGLLLGLIFVLIDAFACWLLPIEIASLLLLLAMIGISGALHLDGLADSADAFFSARGRERMLEIMKDSRSGPMGVTAIVVVLLLKYQLLVSLPDVWRWQVILLMPLAGRSSLSFISLSLPYARSEGTAAFVKNPSERTGFVIAAFLFPLVTLVLFGLSAGLSIAATVMVGCWLLSHYSRSKIGGFTGDTLGASCELVELLPALCVIFLSHRGLL